MEEAHLSLEELARWLAGELSQEEQVQKVVPHLMARCPFCRERYEEILRLQREVGHWSPTVSVFEGLEAPEQYEELMRLPFEGQLRRVVDEEGLQTWGLCQYLLRKSFEAGFEEPTRAVMLAEVAVYIAEHLVEEAYDPNWLLDLRARAWAHLGNARRVLGELWSADAAFRRAEAYLEKSLTGNSLVEAEIADLKGSLRRAQRRLSEALQLNETALALYRANEHGHGVAKTLVQKAKIQEESGDLAGALEVLAQAIAEIDPEADPRLLVYARHNQLSCLTSADRHEEAEALLPEVRALFEGVGTPLDLVRLRWAEGRIALGRGLLEAAEEAFFEAQREFQDRRMAFDAALVSLDLAAVYVRQGATAELKRLAVELMPVFESREVNREAMAALLLFQSAAEEEILTLDLVRHIADFLRHERPAHG